MLPEFLVIGAMKAGTTTLFHDLRTHTRAFIPDKELNALTDDGVLSSSGQAAYAARYDGIRRDQRAGDVSTTYAMAPEIPGCAERARRVLKAETKIIYLIRHPIERILSQHHHERQAELVSSGIDDAVRQHERYVAFSQYARQLDPWIDAFGIDKVMVVSLEEYHAARTVTVERISEFIDAPFLGDEIDGTRVFNESRAKPLLRGGWQTFQESGFYRRAIRRLLSAETRARVRNIALPRSTMERETPSAETVTFLIERLSDDLERQRRMLGDMVAAYQPESLLRRHRPPSESAAGLPTDR